jgi:hypothetical protein
MSNPMKYVKDLEAAGFQRAQAEAQVQVVLDALEGDLVTKSDFAVFQEKLENRFQQVDARFQQVDARFQQVDARFAHLETFVLNQIKESEFRLSTRIGFMIVSTTSIAVAVLTWLIKI